MRVTNQKINFLSKGHSTEGPKIPFISNPKKPTCASKRFMLELAILQCVNVSGPQFSLKSDLSQHMNYFAKTSCK